MSHSPDTPPRQDSAPPPPPVFSGERRGFLGGVRDGKVRGWAVTESEEAPARINLWLDGSYLGTATADDYREDLEKAGLRGGRAAFLHSVPKELQTPGFHLLEARHADTGNPLRRSPSRVEFRTSNFLKEKEVAALIGKQGWNFLCNDGNRLFEQYWGNLRLSKDEVEDWRRVFARREDFFGKRGIPYVFALIPGKESVYPEYLPDGIPSMQEPQLADAVLNVLSAPGICTLDLRGPLLAAKAQGQLLYYRNDSHWNFQGGFVAAQIVLRALSGFDARLWPWREGEFEWTRSAAQSADLADKPQVRYERGRFVVNDIHPDLRPEDHLKPRFPVERQLRFLDVAPHLQESQSRRSVLVESDADGPTLMMFRDSFAAWVTPFLAPKFARSSYLWQPNVSPSAIDAERPGMVVQMMVDRFLRVVPAQ